MSGLVRDGVMPVSGLTGVQARLIADSPVDGSLDFYVAAMVGLPVRRVAVERARLRDVLQRVEGRGMCDDCGYC